MAFSVSDDHDRQEQVWDLLAHSYNKSGAYIRGKLTEDKIRAADRRVRFIGVDVYVAAGGYIMRDLSEEDDGGWLANPALLDRLRAEQRQGGGEQGGTEGGEGVATAPHAPRGG